MKIKQAIKYAGSREALAALAGVSVTTVRRWEQDHYIPVKTQVYIEAVTRQELKAEGIKLWKK